MKNETNSRLCKAKDDSGKKNTGKWFLFGHFWIVRCEVNHPLMFRQLLVRYLVTLFLLLTLLFTVIFYVRKGRHIRSSPQADALEWVDCQNEAYVLQKS